MMKLNLTQISRRTVATALAIAGLAATPVGAQQPPAPPPPPSQAAAQNGTLRLSMNEAVQMALEWNLGLKADRMDVEAADQNIVGARAAFLPQLSSRFGRSSGTRQPTDFTQGSLDITSRGLSLAATVGQALPWYGGVYGVSWTGSRNDQIGGISSFNPSINSSLVLNFTQPLLAGFRVDSARVGLETSQRSRSIADLTLQQRLVGAEVTVKLAYLNLVAAVEGRKVAQQAMDIADQSLKHARARVAVGSSPQIDVIEAEAQAAGNRESLIGAEGRIGTAEDNLRQLILDPSRPDYWQVRLEATDTIVLTPFQVDIDAAIKNALANRLDLIAFRQNMEITDLTADLNKNLTMPSVNLELNYSASATSGTQFEFGDGFPPPVLSRTDRSFGSALGDTFSGAYPNWSAFVRVAYPIGQTGTKVALARTQIQKRQQELDVRNLELQIVRDVREAARQVQNSFERVQAARVARDAAERQLDAENRRFEVGMSTTLAQQQRQRDLSTARNTELSAMISYNSALIQFQRVQRIQ